MALQAVPACCVLAGDNTVGIDAATQSRHYSPLSATDSRGRVVPCIHRRAEMDFRRQALFIIALLVSVLGCRHDQAAKRELLERELRLQEDRIYALEDALEDAQRELDRARGIVREDCPPGSRPGLGRLFGGDSGGSSIPPPPASNNSGGATSAPSNVNPGSSSGAGTSSPPVVLPPKGDTAPPAVELPPPSGSSAPPFRGAPVISPPDPKKPEGVPAPGGPAPPFRPGGAQRSTPEEGSTARREPILKEMSSPKFLTPGTPPTGPIEADEVIPAPALGDRIVKSVTLNRRTGGWNSDGKPGDEGISVVVEPRNARGEVVATAGKVSVVLIDPAAEGEAGRFARWDFTADAAGAMFRAISSGGSGGMHFELNWPETPPVHAKLTLFVRFTTDDGQRFDVRKDLFVDLGQGVSSAWKNPAAQPPTNSEPIYTATRAGGRPTTDTVVPTGGNVAPATPLNWGRPKPAAAPSSPAMLASPMNAQPLENQSGPALFAPQN